ncbi:hypothetical protein BJF85_16670 [Saccharomonospora sp. CUA-673]|uniref:hypothetical protein n=1 Tax=Saccharomonospora sp. CUA-673 TaxID=1904969 RepID=UPI0009628A4E|nr:hypothetical protein [Saccharomonospora sp. CUA-673]OLT46477.1 hypothetical protein BJF85_16670 [Saccharomonospora sp. CUA-673]
MAKISTSLPVDNRNGLDKIAASMVDNPEQRHIIVAIVDTKTIATDCDTGDVTPTARIRAIEGLTVDSADGKEARRLWRRAFERRTGQVELPIELERELDGLSGDGDM